MASKNLGNVRALIVSSTPPSNTNLLWRDTSVSPFSTKEYDNVGMSWVELKGTTDPSKLQARVVYVSSTDEIRNFTTTELADNYTVIVKQTNRLYKWNGTSTATDDDRTVIKPAAVTTGRFLEVAKFTGQLKLVAVAFDGDNINTRIDDVVIMSEPGTVTLGNQELAHSVAITVTSPTIIQQDADTGVIGDFTQYIIAGSGGGEANTASNLGTGAGLFLSKSGVDLRFKSIKAGDGIFVSPTTTEVIISHNVTPSAITLTKQPGDSVSVLQAQLDATPRNLNRYTLYITFATGTHLLNGRIDLQGFYNGTIFMIGQTYTPGSTSTQTSIINCQSSGYIDARDCNAQMIVKGLKFTDVSVGNAPYFFRTACPKVSFESCFFDHQTIINLNVIQTASSHVNFTTCKFNGQNAGVICNMGILLGQYALGNQLGFYDCDSTGFQPFANAAGGYGTIVVNGSTSFANTIQNTSGANRAVRLQTF